MATKYVNMGRNATKQGALTVYAYEDTSPLPQGVFFGYIRGVSVKLYPADYVTKTRYKGDALDITIYDLKARYSLCM